MGLSTPFWAGIESDMSPVLAFQRCSDSLASVEDVKKRKWQSCTLMWSADCPCIRWHNQVCKTTTLSSSCTDHS